MLQNIRQYFFSLILILSYTNNSFSQKLISGSNIFASANFVEIAQDGSTYSAGTFLTYEAVSENTLSATSYKFTLQDSVTLADSCGYTHYSNSLFVSRISASGIVSWTLISSLCDTLRNFSIIDLQSDAQSNVYVLGVYSNQIDLDEHILSTDAKWDLFLYKLSPQGTILWSKSSFAVGALSAVIPTDLKIVSNNVYISGNYTGMLALKEDTLTSIQTQFFLITLSEHGEELSYSAGLSMNTQSYSNLTAISHSSTNTIFGIWQAQDSVMVVNKKIGNTRDTISQIFAFEFINRYVVDKNNVISHAAIFDTIYSPTPTDTLFIVEHSNIINTSSIIDTIEYTISPNYIHTYVCELSDMNFSVYNECINPPHAFYIDSKHGNKMYGLYNFTNTLNISNTTLIAPSIYKAFAIVEYNLLDGIAWNKIGYSPTDSVWAVNFQVADGIIYIAGNIGTNPGNNVFYFNNQKYTSSKDEDAFAIKLANNSTEWVQIIGDISNTKIQDICVQNENTITAVGSYTKALEYNNIIISTSGIQDIFIADIDPFPQFDLVTSASANYYAPLCQGDSVLLVAKSEHTTKFRWMKDGVAIPLATSDSLWIFDLGNYYLQAESNTLHLVNGDPVIKTSKSFTIVFHEYPNSIITNSKSTTLCQGESTDLHIDTELSDICVWYEKATGYIDSIFKISVNQSGIYYASIENIYGCISHSDSIEIQVMNIPDDSIGIVQNNHLFCSGDSLTIVCNDTGNNTYTWFKNNDSLTQTNIGHIDVFESGKYSSIIVNEYGCLTQTKAIEILEISPPQLTTWFPNTNGICEGEIAEISISSHNDTKYIWIYNNDTLSTDSYSIEINKPGKYYAIAVTAGVCHTYSDTIELFVHSLPQGTIHSLGDTIICKFTTTELQIQSSQQLEYTWLYNNQIIAHKNEDKLTVSDAGKYSAIITNEFHCSLQTESITVAVKNSPQLQLMTDADKIAFCEGDSLRLFIHNPLPYIYEWRKNNVPLVTNGTHLYAKNSGEFSVYITDTIYNCSATTNSVNIEMHSITNKALQYTPHSPLCDRDTIVLEATQNAINYAWFYNSKPILMHTYSALPATRTGTYYAIITDEHNCSAKTDEIMLTFLENEIPPIHQDREFISTRLYNSITWHKNNEAIQDANNQVFLIQESGKYYVEVVQESGCVSKSDTIEVCVPFPEITIQKNELQASNGSAYQWFYENDTIYGATESKYFAQITGNYSVAITLANNCVSQSLPVHLCYPVPEITVEKNNVLRSSLGLEYQWYRNNTPIPDADARLFVYMLPGTYYVEVKDLEGCSSVSDPILVNTTNFSTIKHTEYSIYPNPCLQEFVLTMPEYRNTIPHTLYVYNAIGQLLFIQHIETLETHINIEFIPSGLYRVVVQSKDFKQSFVLQKL